METLHGGSYRVSQSEVVRNHHRVRKRLSALLHHLGQARTAKNVDQPAVPIQQYLLEAASSSTLAIESLPKRVDLGEIGREADRLQALSTADPVHPEYASVACLDRTNRLLIPSQPVRGDENSARLPAFLGKRPVLVMHTHADTDIPFSPSDLEALLLDPTRDGAVPVGLLITQSRKLLLLRTARTPALDAAHVQDAIVMLYLHPEMEDEHELYKAAYEANPNEAERSRVIPLTSDQSHRLEELGAKRMSMLLAAAQEYHLAMYSCAAASNIVSRAD